MLNQILPDLTAITKLAVPDNGLSMLPFHPSFFYIPEKIRCDILPVTINHLSVNGQKLNPLLIEKISWLKGFVPFLPHLWQLLKLKTIEVKVTVNGTISVTQNNLGKIKRKELCRQAETRIKETFVSNFKKEGIL